MVRRASAVLLALGAACATPDVPGPEGVVRTYVAAVSRGEVAAAAACLDPRVVPAADADVGAVPGEGRAEATRRAAAFARALDQPSALVVEAAVDLGDGREVVLRLDGGRWRVVSGLP